jgi:hypothetical protein
VQMRGFCILDVNPTDMNRIAFIAIMSLAMACSSSKHNYASQGTVTDANQDGTSFAKAIVIGEKSETSGVAAEYQWIRQHYPGSKNGGQALTYDKGKPYDVLTITTAGGEKKDVYFDISRFFGKF